MRRASVAGLLALAFAGGLFAQALPRASLGGHVTLEDGSPVAGVRVILTSPALQGTRECVTSERGEFRFVLLEPGDYRVAFTGDAVRPAERDVELAAAATARLEQTLVFAGLAESVTVTGDAESAVPEAGISVASVLRSRDVDRLPNGRSILDRVLLAPGVTDNGPSGNSFLASRPSPAIQISGAMSYENLYLVDGVVVNENARGEPHNLFIEDAIAESSVDTGRVSAEYGRFLGGVVSVVTRSGGNDFSGSFRTSFVNDHWTENDPFNRALAIDNRIDHVDETYEATFGFPLRSDRLWGFAAWRSAELLESRQTAAYALPGDAGADPMPYPFATDNERREVKLTAALTERQNAVVSWIEEAVQEENWSAGDVLSTGATIDRSSPSRLLALHYNIAFSRDAYVEAQLSARRFKVSQDQRFPTDRIGGTSLFDDARGAGYNAPMLGGEPPLHYDNDSWHLKGSYLLPTARWGTHEMRLGWERFRESSFTRFDFTPSAYLIFFRGSILRDAEIFPSFADDGTTTIEWLPIVASPGWTRLVTDSLFWNDRVEWGRRWSGNLGLRYDRNHDRSATGALVSTTAEWSPRLALRFDALGDGRLLFDAGYAKYVAKLHDNLANVGSAAGYPAELAWHYEGPCINCDPFATTSGLLPTDEALRQLFAWFDSIGGTDSDPTADGVFTGGLYPGVTSHLEPGGLRSPTAVESSLGASLALGSRGALRLDLLDRDYLELYTGRRDRTTGQVVDPLGNVWDHELVGNSNRLHRSYRAVEVQAQYRSAALTAAASYTWSELKGNSLGELGCCSANWGHEAEYPEYAEERWHHPVGYQVGENGLSPDQRHTARLWLIWNRALPLGELSVGLLEALDSGRGYQAVGLVASAPYVENPGYARPPQEVDYYFSRPGEFRTDTVTSTDLALTWSVPLRRSIEVFLHGQLFNLFDESSVISVATGVETAVTHPDELAPFNPFVDSPQPGVNYRYAPDFGLPTGPGDYQRPRTFTFSVGLRF